MWRVLLRCEVFSCLPVQESDSSPKRKPCAAELESDSTRKVFRKNNSKSTPVGSSLKSTPVGSNLRSAPAFSVVATAEAPRVQGKGAGCFDSAWLTFVFAVAWCVE